MLYIVTFIIGVIIGVCILLPKTKAVQLDLSQQIQQKEWYQSEIRDLEMHLTRLGYEVNEGTNIVNNLSQKKMNLQDDIKQLEAQASQNAETFLKDKIRIANLSFEKEKEKMSKNFENAKEKAMEEYLNILSDFQNDTQEKLK